MGQVPVNPQVWPCRKKTVDENIRFRAEQMFEKRQKKKADKKEHLSGTHCPITSGCPSVNLENGVKWHDGVKKDTLKDKS